MDFKKQIDKISELARIELSEQEKEKLSGELNKILDYFKVLEKADVKDVEPFLTSSEAKNVFRKDEVGTGENDILKEDFSGREKDYLKIKSVTEEWE